MIRAVWLAVFGALALAGPSYGQVTLGLPLEEVNPPLEQELQPLTDRWGNRLTFEDPPGATRPRAPQRVRAAEAQGAVLRTLDKLTGTVTDLTLESGGAAVLGRLTIALETCRVPANNPSGDAFAAMTIREDGGAAPVFSGWMVASSPALSALDHARYDVWVMRCITS